MPVICIPLICKARCLQGILAAFREADWKGKGFLRTATASNCGDTLPCTQQ